MKLIEGFGDAIIYQWQFSVDNNIWYDVLTGTTSSTNILGAGVAFTANLNGTTITAAQQKADIDKYLAAQVDPDVQRIVYYRLKTTRVNDIDNSGAQNGTESTCEVFSAATQVTIDAQPSLVQTTAPNGSQSVCVGVAVIPITFQWGGSATGIRIINNPGLTSVTNAAAKTVTLSGIPTFTGFVRVETLEALPATCGVVRLDHLVRRVTAPSLPDYIRIIDPGGANPTVPIVADQDGNTYNGQLYSCETALNSAPANVQFDACYNDGRILALTDSYRWYVTPVNAGVMNATTGVMDWDDGFFGDATISVAAVGCDGTETGQLNAVITVNQFNSAATQPTQPTPLLEAQQQRVTFSGVPVTGERYSVFLNGVEYFFVTTDVVAPFDSAGPPIVNGVDQNPAQIAQIIADQINADNTSLVKDLFINVPTITAFNPGDLNFNGLADDTGGWMIVTANYDGNSAPAIPPGGPRGNGGDFQLTFNIEPAPGNARAFGTISNNQLNQTSMNLCGNLTGAEPLCKTTAATPDTQYFSTSTFYSSIAFSIDAASIVPGVGSVNLPGPIDAFTGNLNWNADFHGTFNIETQATGCDGVAFGSKGVHTVTIYDNVGPPSDINYDPLTVPNCPPINATTTTQFSSSSDVTWSISTSAAGVINSSTGLMTWAQGWSGTVDIIATSFGCGDPAVNTFTRSVKIEGSPDFLRTSAIGSINQIVCSGNPLTLIRYEITGGATGADVTGEPTGVTVNTASVNQVNTVTLSGILDEAGDTHTVRINGVNYTAVVGEAFNQVLVGSGDGTVSDLAEVLAVLEYKIDTALNASGFTAAVTAAPALTITSNGFNFDIAVSLNDVDGNDTDTIAVVETINGGLFLEITGNPTSTNTTPTTFPIVITTNGSTCTNAVVNNNITINPLSSLTIQAAMDDNQRLCNNVPGIFTPIVYDIGNSLGVNVTWAPAQPANITDVLTTINQISTITLDGVDGLVAANNTVPYVITINGVPYTYTVNTAAPVLDNEVSDISKRISYRNY